LRAHWRIHFAMVPEAMRAQCRFYLASAQFQLEESGSQSRAQSPPPSPSSQSPMSRSSNRLEKRSKVQIEARLPGPQLFAIATAPGQAIHPDTWRRASAAWASLGDNEHTHTQHSKRNLKSNPQCLPCPHTTIEVRPPHPLPLAIPHNSMIPRRTAIDTACVRSLAPSFSIICLM
jgi:hypothetical protein